MDLIASLIKIILIDTALISPNSPLLIRMSNLKQSGKDGTSSKWQQSILIVFTNDDLMWSIRWTWICPDV